MKFQELKTEQAKRNAIFEYSKKIDAWISEYKIINILISGCFCFDKKGNMLKCKH